MSLDEMDGMDDDLLDLGEGPARHFDEADEYDEDALDEYDESDDYDEDAFDEYDEADDLDEFGDVDAGDVDAAMEMMVADALQADDTDEFFRRLRRGFRRLRRFGGRIARGVGRVARIVGPIASRIPLPWAQAIGRVANVVGQVMADGADEFDALDELFDLVDDGEMIDAAAPVIAGLTIRSMIPRAGRLPLRQRRALVRGVARATRSLVRRRGPGAARAIRPVVRSVARRVARGQVRPAQVARAVQATAGRVARSATAVQRLSVPRTMAGRRRRRRGARRMTLRGPVTIVIRGGN